MSPLSVEANHPKRTPLIDHLRSAPNQRLEWQPRAPLLAILIRWCTLCSLTLICPLGCQSPPPDHIGDLLELLEGQRWAEIESRYLNADQLSTFPLKRSLERGYTWIRVTQIRKIGQQFIFAVDLKAPTSQRQEGTSELVDSAEISSERSESPSSVERHIFWVNAPQPRLQGDSDLAHKSQTFRGSPLEGELGPLGLIAGWTPPRRVHSSSVDDLSQLPARFSVQSYRVMRGHEPALRNARAMLGVIDSQGSGTIEPGWRGTFNTLDTHWHSTDTKHRGCQRPKKRSKHLITQLDVRLSSHCLQPLLRAAQRQRYTQSFSHQPDIDIGDGGGRELRVSSTQTIDSESYPAPQLDPKAMFNGRISLRQSLGLAASLRPLATITEAIIIAPALTQCIQREVKQWAITSIPRSVPCDVEPVVLFKVSPERSSSSTQP